MTVSPSYLVLPLDTMNSGKNVDNVQLTNENSVVVQRQVVNVADPVIASNRQTVNSSGGANISIIPLPASQLTPFVINSSSMGSLPIVTSVAGKSVKLYRLILFVGGTTNITIEDNITPLTGPIPLYASGSIALDFSGDPWFQSSLGNTLNIVSSQAVQLSGTAYYVQS